MLSHPTIVEAAHSLFVPACVYNNTEGDADAAVRKAFEEPAWNNPVVRILGADRKDLVPRISDRWTIDALATEMVTALAAGAPPWLRLFAEEQAALARGVDTAIFGMG